MKVIFLDDIPNVADAGETKEVANGYARNFLIPKKLALPAQSPDATQMLAIKKRIAQAKAKKVSGQAELLKDKEVTLSAKVGVEGKLYGSVTNADIAKELEKVAGVAIDKKKIDLEKPLHQLGSYDIAIKLGQDTVSIIKVHVVAEEAPEEEAKAKKRAAKAADETSTEVEEPAAEQAAEAPADVEEPKAEVTAETPDEAEEPTAEAPTATEEPKAEAEEAPEQGKEQA